MATSGKKAGSIAGSRKFEPPKVAASRRLCGEIRVAPYCRNSSGAITPKTEWLLSAEIEMAPFRRKFTGG
jgi:hypothetical protein